MEYTIRKGIDDMSKDLPGVRRLFRSCMRIMQMYGDGLSGENFDEALRLGHNARRREAHAALRKALQENAEQIHRSHRAPKQNVDKLTEVLILAEQLMNEDESLVATVVTNAADAEEDVDDDEALAMDAAKVPLQDENEESNEDE